MTWRRWAAVAAIAIAGLMTAGGVFAFGWPLPLRQECSGDVCVGTVEVDWDRIDWSLRPSRLSCFDAQPEPNVKLIGPGEVCVRAQGDREVDRATYEQLRDRWAHRRTRTLIGVAAVLAGTVGAVAVVAFSGTFGGRRRRPAPASPP
jgi:hypothetical protein